MRTKQLSIFVDESGNFGDLNDSSHYRVVTMIFHDCAFDLSRQIAELDRANSDLGLDAGAFIFHTAPLIRQEDEFRAMNRHLRGRIFGRMLDFVRRIEFKHHSFHVDARFATSTLQIVQRLEAQITEFALHYLAMFEQVEQIKVYYDGGQKEISRLLRDTLAFLGKVVEFAQGPRHCKYKLFQVADLVCTVRLMELRLANDESLNLAEKKFFGGERAFKRNVLKVINAKAI